MKNLLSVTIILCAYVISSCKKDIYFPKVNPSLTVAPAEPRSFAAFSSNNANVVKWAFNAISDSVIIYTIYGGTNSTKLVKIGMTMSSIFNHPNLDETHTYYYCISAINRLGESFRSPIVSAIPYGPSKYIDVFQLENEPIEGGK